MPSFNPSPSGVRSNRHGQEWSMKFLKEVAALPRSSNFLKKILQTGVVLFAVAFTARAQDQTVQLLALLANAPGPPGFEEPVRKIMVERMTPLADKITYDGLGSVIATQGSSGPRVMIDAHMDELGAVARRITPDGFVTMQMLGGWLDEALVGQRWIIIGSKGAVRATSNARDAHLTAAGDRDKLIDTRDRIFLDIGAKNADEARQMGVAPGDPIVP